MKRILILAMLVVFLMLLASPPRVAQEKRAAGWRTVGDFKVLKLWETDLGPSCPEIAILQLSNERREALEANALVFLRKYEIFPKLDEVRGHFVLHLDEQKTAHGDRWFAVVVHDCNTYAGFGAFEVSKIK